ncbi:hypothetical protein [Rahnella sp. Larv3_ips]|uniref:hypothetical protein n=1 Tax=Rahnella sp. Larv3_ips TaxID=1896943 RepID=UPI000EFD3A3E|nr:hypothetical protein [Rahnella sp. Larv3_ips]
MKLLKNEFEYKMWMTYDFLRLDEGLSPLFDHDLLERELLAQMPEQFPCIAYIVKGPSLFEPDEARFIYRPQLEEWSQLMDSVTT